MQEQTKTPIQQTIPTPSNTYRPSRKIIFAFIVFSFAGLLDAGYLTMKHYTGGTIRCSILDGCDSVTSSIYADIGGIPIALFGLLFYIMMFVVGVSLLEKPRQVSVRFITYTTTAALLVSAGLVYLQIFAIQALCLYCLLSAIFSVTLFVIAQMLRRRLQV